MSTNFQSLWVEKYRPKSLDEIVLSRDDREFFENLSKKQEIPHLLFAGVQGVGKSTIAKIIVNEILDCQYLYINTSDGGGNIDSIRGTVIGFARTKSLDGKTKVVLLDELDSASFDAQRALRGMMEDYAETCRFIFTCNYLHKIIPALQSRCQMITLNPPIDGVIQRVVSILKNEKILIPEEQKPLLLEHVKDNLPDIRRIVNDIQKFSVTGTLNIRAVSCSDFASDILKKIQSKKDLMKLRKEIIENERIFANDYHQLQKELFEAVFNSDIELERKGDLLLVVSRGMEVHSLVIDKEINCFSTLLTLSRNIFS